MTDNTENNETLHQLEQPSEPFEAAGNMFSIYKPRFELLVKDLSTGQLRRLLNAIVQYPLNDKEFITEESTKLKEAFRLGNQLIQARTIMTLAVAQEEEMKRAEQENNKENENG